MTSVEPAAGSVGSFVIWRHPRPEGASGRCIGRTDLLVDARRAKRLAHRIRRTARREGGPAEIWTSPLRRCADVGRWLRRWGWTHHVDPRLIEMDFGDWDGRPWSDIGPDDFSPWDVDFLHHAPGGGESVRQLRSRVTAVWAEVALGSGATPRFIVGHAGWINALKTLHLTALSPAQWPAAVAYAERVNVPDLKPAERPGWR